MLTQVLNSRTRAMICEASMENLQSRKINLLSWELGDAATELKFCLVTLDVLVEA